MKEEIERYLAEHYNIRRVEINRNVTIKGSPAIEVSVFWTDGKVPVVSVSKFSAANKMLPVEMAAVMDSYMKKGRYADA